MDTSTAERMPALYIGHGAPPLLDDPRWSAQLAAWARDLPRPRAILIVSAHWESAPIALSASGVELVYDFGGFDPKYYLERYDTPDASDLAARVAALMPATEPVHQHSSRGLDHGAWVPLKLMYPEADIPVLQMSLPNHDPERLLAIGRRLQALRDEGVLIVGSGFLTHGLPFLRDFRIDAPPPGWSTDFDAWAAEALSRGDVDELAAYRDRAPGMPYAHPSVEHYSPLFVTLGAATDPGRPGTQVIADEFWMGLSKRSLQVS
ncbi:dioxygenase [Nocardioides panacisoli]|uniref:dioxygenase family protein n=1 Tax=Nocardioides panacisoli TaxID=627624 RepID=UPI001C63B6A8|nr:class III extradiol ring-cleavage dioxygenase [Nocardioides panacisoli]QYJ04012.1 dioxygenase [Nocardioides panacisoli]